MRRAGWWSLLGAGCTPLLASPVSDSLLQDKAGIHELSASAISEALADAAQATPQHHVELLKQVGRQLLADGYAPDARGILEHAIQDQLALPEDDFELHYLAAYSAELMWDSIAAKDHLSAAMQLRQDYVPGWLRLATHALQLGDGSLAELAIAASEEIGGPSAYAHYLRAQLRLQQQQWRGAAAELQQALRLQPQANALYAALGQALSLAGDSQAAQQALSRRGPIKPGLEDPLIAALMQTSNSVGQLAEAGGRALESGDSARAIELYRRALQRTTDPPPQVPFNLGLALTAVGQPEEALDALGDAIALDPDYVKAHLQSAQVLKQLGRFEQAAVHYQSALQLEPANLAGRVNFANLLRSRQQWLEALPHQQWLVENLPTERAGWIGLIECHDGLGDQQALRQAVEGASRQLPRDALVLEYRLRFISVWAPEAVDAQAVAQAEALFNRSPTPGSMETLALVHAAAGDYERAAGLMRSRAQRLERMARTRMKSASNSRRIFPPEGPPG